MFTTFYALATEDNSDMFYCLSDECIIWEYAESGKKFTIMHMDEGQKCKMECQSRNNLRE